MTANSLRKFYIDNKFYVKVIKINNQEGCVAHLPKIIIDENNIPKETRTYLIVGSTLEIYSSIDKTIKSTSMNLDRYTIRPIIIEDIILQSYKRKLSTDLIFPIIDKQPVIDRNAILEVISIKLEKDEKSCEKKLVSLLYKVLIKGSCSDHVPSDINDGYDRMVNLFKVGGIKL